MQRNAHTGSLANWMRLTPRQGWWLEGWEHGERLPMFFWFLIIERLRFREKTPAKELAPVELSLEKNQLEGKIRSNMRTLVAHIPANKWELSMF